MSTKLVECLEFRIELPVAICLNIWAVRIVEHAVDPGLPFKRDHSELPSTGEQVALFDYDFFWLFERRGHQDLFENLALVPPVQEDPVAIFASVNDQKTNSVSGGCAGWVFKKGARHDLG